MADNVYILYLVRLNRACFNAGMSSCIPGALISGSKNVQTMYLVAELHKSTEKVPESQMYELLGLGNTRSGSDYDLGSGTFQ